MKVPICAEHNKAMIKIKGQYYCPDCIYSSHLTYTAQKEAVKRWRQSDKGVESEKQYEQSDKGKLARSKYLHSDKYKAARRAYNQRLKESLTIARIALKGTSGSSKLTTSELQVASGLDGLLAEIREFLDENSTSPTVANVVATAKRDYNQIITEAKAKELINAASVRRRK